MELLPSKMLGYGQSVWEGAVGLAHMATPTVGEAACHGCNDESSMVPDPTHVRAVPDGAGVEDTSFVKTSLAQWSAPRDRRGGGGGDEHLRT